MTAELRSKIQSSETLPSGLRIDKTRALGFGHRKVQWALGGAAILSAATVAGLFWPELEFKLVTQSLALSALATTGMALAFSLRAARKQTNTITNGTNDQFDDCHAPDLIRAFETNECGWFWRTDIEGRLTYISANVAHQLGCKVSQLLGTPLKELVLQDDGVDFAEAPTDHTVEFTLRAGLQFRDLVVKSAKDTENHWALSGTPIRDRKGRLAGFLGSGLNLSEQRRRETEAARLALYDALTGLPNRVLIRQTLDDLLRGKTGRAGDCGLFLMDLDRFKNVNDTLGHPVGDELLKLVAKRLARVIGNQGQFGRLGGDEFQVVIPQVTDRAKLAELADAIITRLSLPYMINDCTVQIGATIGIAISPLDGVDADELTRNADLALYAAKAAGKGVHRFFQPQMHQQANHRRALEDDLREVLEKGELHLAYQQIVDAKSEQTVGYEALLRWDHPVRGSVSPAEFVPIAEESGLINRIGDWVIRTACEEAAQWPDHLRLSVNLSPVQFKSASLAPTIMHALADSGLDPQRLELEVTEGVLLHEDALVERVVNQLTSMNVRLVLDDFGVGYASLGYLRRLPFSKIKIDQSFVRGAVDERARNKEIICAIVGLANSLGMETVAEGVETLDEIELIRVLGCTQIQGFVFGRPTNAADTRARAMKLVPPTSAYDPELADGEPKIAVLRVARLHTDGKSFAVKIRAVSGSGATIEAPGDAAIGVAVELALTDGWQLAGEVVWRKGGRFGVSFDQVIDLDAFMSGGRDERGRDEDEDEEPVQTAHIARAA
jgi:diguanylate cyclase (GGDEF)-like protein